MALWLRKYIEQFYKKIKAEAGSSIENTLLHVVLKKLKRKHLRFTLAISVGIESKSFQSKEIGLLWWWAYVN